MDKKNLDGKNLWELFDSRLAPYAQHNADSRGREYFEIPDPERLPFQRDRDRIIHTKSFRRLRGKMQVVSPKKGDHYRNRLSHTLEVTQIARDLARWLRLNEDLAEAIALAHDLGHPPFGHSGEEVLNEKMQEHGSHFEHNQQSLRVVEVFESRYSDFSGLNLTYEVREGIQKHETFFDRPGGERIFTPHLEAQLVDISDAIAYLSADLEDGLRGGFFEISDLKKVSLPAEAIESLDEGQRSEENAIIRRVIHNLLQQIIVDTDNNLNKKCVQSIKDVQKSQDKIVAFSPDFSLKFAELKDFLWDRFYSASEVRALHEQGERAVRGLFDFFMKHPENIPQDFLSEEPVLRRICDYIAGMTDQFALEAYEALVTKL